MGFILDLPTSEACRMDEMSIRSLFSEVLESFDIVSKIDIGSVKRYKGTFFINMKERSSRKVYG